MSGKVRNRWPAFVPFAHCVIGRLRARSVCAKGPKVGQLLVTIADRERMTNARNVNGIEALVLKPVEFGRCETYPEVF